MLLNDLELTSLIFPISADGVRGGVRRRSESVVVCDFSRVVAALTASRGFEEDDSCAGDSLLVGPSEFWKCSRSASVDLVKSTRDLRFAFLAMTCTADSGRKSPSYTEAITQ